MPEVEPPASKNAGSPGLPVEALDSRLRWRFVSLVGFGAWMLALGGAAALSLLAPIRTVSGLPDDGDARGAQQFVRNHFPFGTGPYRFASALTGEARAGWPYSAEAADAAAMAEALIARARKHASLEPRLIASLGHLDLGRRLFKRAESRYRLALELAPHYGEAHLGLGVALALSAEFENDALDRRGLRLAALAQFIAVREDDPVYPHALYDRVLLLEDVGRHAEAERAVRAYLALDPSSEWAGRLKAIRESPER
jgi:tetratricopeptide (TPR) repeat protein